MRNKFSLSNAISKQEYKVEDICAGLNCYNKPTSILKVKYINKIGGFCKQHTEDLLQLELAEEIVNGDINNE
jgi:hypothetical protein